ncbi:MAG: UDP-3-O-acyl-N-acetylglucosamine deacetylase [Bacillota bacterium]
MDLVKEGDKQQTVAEEVSFSGTALHTGKEVKVKFIPAKAGTGIVFRRTDLPSKPEIRAEPLSVVSTRRCTSLGTGEEETVHTVEHIMAALWACGVDNVFIEINGPETPVADGSSRPFVDLLRDTGIKTLSAARNILIVDKPLWVRREDMYITCLPYEGFKISYTLDYEHQVIGTQFYEFEGERQEFIEQISRARTYGFKWEIEALHRKGLALGGSLKNAVLIGEEDTVNSLRYQNEFVRHKVLDLVGDMALNGCIRGHIISVRSGHSLHVELARKIYKNYLAGE